MAVVWISLFIVWAAAHVAGALPPVHPAAATERGGKP